MSDVLEITSHPTMGEYVRSTVRATRGFAVGTVAFAYLGGGSVLLVLIGAPVLDVAPSLAIGALLWSGVFVAPIAWFMARSRRDLVLAATKLRFGEDGIQISSVAFTGTQAWSVYRRARETDEAFILEAGAGMGAMIVRRGIPASDEARLREFLSRRGLLRPSTTAELVRPLIWVAVGLVLALGQFFLQGGTIIL